MLEISNWLDLMEPHGQSPCLHAEVHYQSIWQGKVSVRRRGLLRRRIKGQRGIFSLAVLVGCCHLLFQSPYISYPSKGLGVPHIPSDFSEAGAILISSVQ